MILDLVQPLAAAFFAGSLPASQTTAQAAILVVLGLQHHALAAAASALQLPTSQALALLLKSVKCFVKLLKSSKEEEIERALPSVAHVQVHSPPAPKLDGAPAACCVPCNLQCGRLRTSRMQRMQAQAAALEAEAQPLEEELEEGAAAWQAAQSRKLASLDRAGLEADKLEKYAIRADDDAFAARLEGSVPTGVVQVCWPLSAV